MVYNLFVIIISLSLLPSFSPPSLLSLCFLTHTVSRRTSLSYHVDSTASGPNLWGQATMAEAPETLNHNHPSLLLGYLAHVFSVAESWLVCLDLEFLDLGLGRIRDKLCPWIVSENCGVWASLTRVHYCRVYSAGDGSHGSTGLLELMALLSLRLQGHWLLGGNLLGSLCSFAGATIEDATARWCKQEKWIFWLFWRLDIQY